MPLVILGVNELNLDYTSRDINKEELQRPRLRAFLTATDPIFTKELIRSRSL